MDPQTSLQELIKRRDELYAERDRLLAELRDRHSDFYNWLIESKIDVHDLGKYAINVAAAFTFALGVMVPELPNSNAPPQEQITQLVQPVTIISRNELQGLTDEEKAELVWQRYGYLINKTAEKYHLDPKLIFATVMLESGGDTYAVRHEPSIGDSSYGLGQILYGTARSIGFEGNAKDLYDPEINIDLIGKYHRRNQDVYGGKLTVQQLTVAYNTGSPFNSAYPGHMNKFNKWYDSVNNLIT
ncbi:MAG: hypothetical protein UU77_C0048G0004 [candidate division WWE3 bacterium GW2011_GWC1_41_7]|uniref:Transglycosylase SLT domain-containing protein n=3 Tax=Katanobacteria TaxID=422282 RepID=A0A0G0XAM1_UNCKA|nr:MAG: hypothetical protein UU72_C0042G0006 [candidate division WWE3 bacterium GW2011_GWB1_41_6]KKS19426.1 MAG: hypothetical protein UU77_C0048G0004 [candidate division WWE3 bacterium GW2011_GWC1_41_7]KKS21437.1 MAG: hypothetical protein UU80_C0029G0007 [candidate division WWE3 bacterium GW2011_GWA1_41_8]